jgi:predicted MPP superfamily phosphohydrolase
MMTSSDDARMTQADRRRGFHRPGRWIACAIIVLIAAAAFGMDALGVSMPRGVGFRLFLLFVLAFSAVWWLLADESVLAATKPGRARRTLRLVALFVLAAMAAPLVLMLLMGGVGRWTRPPTWYVSAFQVWHMFMMLWLILVALAYAAAGLVYQGVQFLRRRRGKRKTVVRAAPRGAPYEGLSRREWLAAAAAHAPALVSAAPVVLVGGLTAVGGRQTGRFEVNQHDLPAPWLPQRLRGLTITHISDLHLGRFYRPWMLDHLVEQANRLDGDIVVVTGDIVDLSNDMLPPAMDALRQLQNRHGLYLCVGNHDLIDDGRVFISTLKSAGFDLLTNERRRRRIDGDSLTIAGLNWARHDRGANGWAGHAEHVADALAGYDPLRDGPCITLAHHPHAFDALAAAGVPLTLAGHTHGGQLMLSPPPSDGHGDAGSDVGAGRLLFRYLRGFYRRGDATLFVNSGVGNWFPIRLNAPAEITRIRLV